MSWDLLSHPVLQASAVVIYYIIGCINSINMKSLLRLHYKCRNGLYPKCTGVKRFPVPDDKISWDVDWPEYNPVEYTSEHIKGQTWADPDITDIQFKPAWNQLDGLINRKSHSGVYKIVQGRPLNPVGRTGISGRGCLGRYGLNHAADPIVTRWKRDKDCVVIKSDVTHKPILQFVSIERRDSSEWAIPGGMVDPGEVVTTTLKREFLEEALDTLTSNKKEKIEKEKLVNDLFNDGVEIYRGYVDDPRNTDNAWMETVAYNFHDNDGTSVGQFPLAAGDDAVNVKWVDISSNLKLYASHIDFLQLTVNKHEAHW